MPPLPGSERETVNSRFNQVLAIGIWAISAAIAVSLFAIDRPSQLAYLVPLAVVNLLVWEGLWRPTLVIKDDGVEVTNPFRDIRIPWSALVNVDTKFALTLFTPGRKFEVWIAPSPGRSFGYRSAASPIVRFDAHRRTRAALYVPEIWSRANRVPPRVSCAPAGSCCRHPV